MLGSARRASGGFPSPRELNVHFCSRPKKGSKMGAKNGAFGAPKSELYSLWGTICEKLVPLRPGTQVWSPGWRDPRHPLWAHLRSAGKKEAPRGKKKKSFRKKRSPQGKRRSSGTWKEKKNVEGKKSHPQTSGPRGPTRGVFSRWRPSLTSSRPSRLRRTLSASST